jgi:plastocyanin
MRSLFLFAIAAPFIAFAQEVHLVVVGDSTGATKFSPEAISAKPGDIVTFQFHQKNHSVVQSSFDNPCGPKDGGFNSGFMPVGQDVTSDFPEYNITVTDTNPIWVYCGQKIPVSHCGKGMVFAVNCGADGAPNSFTNFKSAAISTASAPPSSDPYGAPPPANSPPDATSGAPGGSGDPTSASAPAPPSDSNVPAGGSSTGTGSIIKIVVGGNSTLSFDPPRVSANPGDTLVFEFQSKNHTVTQSTFADPCLKLNNATSGKVGFDSGFMPVTAGSSQFPTFSITVNDTTPIWAYCKQRIPSSHCGQGMVFAVNSNDSSDKSYSAFVNLAKEKNGTQASASGTEGTSTPSNNGAIQTSTISTLSALSVVGVVMMMVV